MKNQNKIKKHQDPALKRNGLSTEDWEELERGINYFNDGNFAHATDAWKLVSERCSKCNRLFIQTLIDTIEIFQQTDRKEIVRRIDKLSIRLTPYIPEQCGISVNHLLSSLKELKGMMENAGTRSFLADSLSIKLLFSPPSNPDRDVEVSEICANPQFLEGINLFNKGYYWEAHENWEELWRDQSGHGKSFIETFVQMAEGYSFAKKGKTDSATYLFGKVIKKFQEFGRAQCRISISSILRDIEKVVVEINTFRRNGNTQFKFSSQPVIVLNKKEQSAQ